ncbi:6-phosphofructo-2-kinase-like protein [Leishmania tarentolae]|uniref:6-phosphofructo-2-kinase-like protein n=1 Tax=Leishmania tarentolae TaxID=5689 RepID=A0A640KAF8_LEITA|nr:6-phosphofructo-2-kinase-like protein [Leishmania tarentolae]
MEFHVPATQPSASLPLAADVTALTGDVKATATLHLNMQRSNSSVSVPDLDSTSSERIAASVGTNSATTTGETVSMALALPTFSSSTNSIHMAVPHGSTRPTVRSAGVAGECYNTLSSHQAGEEQSTSDVVIADVGRDLGSRCQSLQRQHHFVAHVHADVVVAEDSALRPTPARHHRSHHHCHRAHCSTHHNCSARTRKTVAAAAITVAPAAPAGPAADTHPLPFYQDMLRAHNCGTSDRSGSRGSSCSCSSHSDGHSIRSCDDSTAIVSSSTRFLSAKTPVSLIGTAYHTLFSPDFSCLNHEAIVERIVGHCPRAYHTWVWRKAKVYQELHALNAHKNSMYQQPTTAVGSPVVMEAVTGCVTAAHPHTTFKVSLAASLIPPTGPSTDLDHSPPTGSLKQPHISSSTSNEMPFRRMSSPPMHTIPTSQQGPEYFKAAAQDGTETLIIVMVGLPACGKTFLAQKICRLLGWHGSRAKMQNIQVAWRRMLLEWEAAHPEMAAGSAHTEAGHMGKASVPAEEGRADAELLSCQRGASHGALPPTRMTAGEGTTTTSPPTASTVAPAPPTFTLSSCPADTHSTQVVQNLPTRSLNASARYAMAASLSGGHAFTSHMPSATTITTTATFTANDTFAAGCSFSRTLLDTSVAAAPRSSASTSIVCLDCSTSPVCPSMQAHTASSLEDSIAKPTSEVASASASLLPGTRVIANAVTGITPNIPHGPGSRYSPTAAVSGGTTSDGGAPSLEACAGASPRTAVGVDGIPPSAEVLRTRHFRELIEQPTSVSRRLYRCVLESFAEDCRLFFQHGGEVVVVNDDFITEELRQEAETLFRPLATQLFYIEVIRDAEEDPLDFVRCKIRDPMEYPLNCIDPTSASADFHERLAFLESVYETLKEAPKTTNARQTPDACAAGAATTVTETGTGGNTNNANDLDAKASAERDTALAFLPTMYPESTHHPQQSTWTRSYVKITNSSTIETHGISGYLASRIISYVMNLSQVKIQHPIYFVLHGESYYNVEGRIGGNTALTEQGMRDAVALLEFLDSLKRHLKHVDRVQRAHHTNQERLRSRVAGNDEDCRTTPNVCANTANTLEVWTSQLRRAIQTTELSERLLNIRTLRWSSLNEIHAGICEDMTHAEVKAHYPLIDYFSKANTYSFRYPEGESYQDLVIRLEPVIMELENADRVVVVVAHQAVLRCLLAYFGSTSAESSIGVEVPHRTVWRCTYDSKGIAILDELRLDGGGTGLPSSEERGTAHSI